MQELDTQNKLLMLFILDKFDLPITDNALVEMVTGKNDWLPHLDCQLAIGDLVDTNFVYQSYQDGHRYYSITPNGRQCVSHFYHNIPQSLQREISEYIKKNRMNMRRNQEYFRHYTKNPDGTYTVTLKIIDPYQTTLDLKIIVSSEQSAKQAYTKWTEKAARTYHWLHEELLNEDN